MLNLSFALYTVEVVLNDCFKEVFIFKTRSNFLLLQITNHNEFRLIVKNLILYGKKLMKKNAVLLCPNEIYIYWVSFVEHLFHYENHHRHVR